eukprot:2078328-Pyramimonas_sp.AAC.1
MASNPTNPYQERDVRMQGPGLANPQLTRQNNAVATDGPRGRMRGPCDGQGRAETGNAARLPLGLCSERPVA